MTYNLFISHSWGYSEDYEGLIRLLNNADNFVYKNYSVPKDDPIHNAHTKAQLKAAIERQMRPASCVIILAGVYSSYSEWINTEIGLAQEMDKKIIAVEKWGAERTSTVVKDAADILCKWNSKSIVDAIKGK